MTVQILGDSSNLNDIKVTLQEKSNTDEFGPLTIISRGTLRFFFSFFALFRVWMSII